jgi:hypothetical protein
MQINMLQYHNNNHSKFGKANGRAFERSIELRDLLISALTNISSTNLNFYKLKFKNVSHINNIARITYDDYLHNNSIVDIKDFVANLHSFFEYIAFADFDSEEIIEHGDELVLLFRGLIYINSISEQRDFIDEINKNLNDYDYFKQHFDYLIIDKNKDVGFINDYDFKTAMHYNQQNSNSNTHVFNDMIYHGINQLVKAITDYVVNFIEFDIVII